MIRILFVDDEELVLRGLRRSLTSHRSKWEMAFVTSGAAALEELSAKPYDIVVSDLRMPGMDGLQLLAEVKARFPETVRVVLSGHADKDLMRRAFTVAQQFLGKPCNSDVLAATLARAVGIHDLVADPALRSTVGALSSVPMLARNYEALCKRIGASGGNAAAAGAAIEAYPATSARLVELANTAFLSSGRRVESARKAVEALGVDFVWGVLVSLSISELLSAPPAAVAGLQEACVAAARTVRLLAEPGSESERDAFWAALLQETGWLVLANEHPDLAAEIARRVAAGGRRCDAERELFGVGHASVGGYVLAVLGLPLPIVDAVRLHGGDAAGNPGGPLELLLVANRLARARGYALRCGESAGAPWLAEFANRATARLEERERRGAA